MNPDYVYEPLHFNVMLTSNGTICNSEGTIMVPVKDFSIGEKLTFANVTVICPTELCSEFEEVHGCTVESYCERYGVEYVFC